MSTLIVLNFIKHSINFSYLCSQRFFVNKKVQQAVSQAVTEYEKKITEEIKNNRNKIWENISKLRSNNEKKDEVIHLYNREGKLIPESETEKEMINEWQKIYCKHENKIGSIWNEDQKIKYEEDMEKERSREAVGEILNRNIIEHFN